MKKLLVSLISLLLIAAMIFSGCAPKDDGKDQPDETKDAATEGGTITIMASQDWVKDPEMELAKKFKEETGITVEYQIIPADQYPNLLTTKLNSGECADIYMFQIEKTAIRSLLQVEKNAVDLSNEPWASTVIPAAKDQLTVNGKLYGQLFYDTSDSYVMIYNKTMFKEMGLEAPSNYAQFLEVCQKLTDAGVVPIYECVADGWHHVLNFFDVSAVYDASSATLVDDLNANKTTYSDHPIFAEVLSQMKEVADKGYLGEYYMSNEFSDLNSSLASGEYAMACNMMGRIADISTVEGEYTADDFGIFPVPFGDNQIIAETPCGPTKFIYSGSKNIELAKKYLDFLAQPENLQYLIENEAAFNSMPFTGIKTTYPDVVREAIEKYKPGTATVYQNMVSYTNPQWMEIGTDIASMYMGEMTPEQVVKNIDQRRADQAAAAKDPNWD